jgi:pilus assembly protein CpaD
MKNSTSLPTASRRTRASLICSLSLVSIAALSVAACKTIEAPDRVAGWSMIDPSERHPILVSQQPHKLSIRVARGSQGLSPHQRAQLIAFFDKYRANDVGNSRFLISAPAGAANEVASMQAIAEIRYLMRESRFDESLIQVEPYSDERDPQPPIRISYSRYVAEGPECGRWPANLAVETQNLPYANLGCATQRNFAAQIANPADLLGPRTTTAAPAERRDTAWAKWTKGESTISQKNSDERAQVKGAN